MTLNVWLLGVPTLEFNGQPILLPGAKSLALMAYLALERHPHSREALATLFWGDAPQDHALASLRQTLFKIRHSLPQACIQTSRSTVQIGSDLDLWVDADELMTVVQQEARPTIAELAGTVALYKGEFMAGVNLLDAPEFEQWQNRQRQRVANSLRTALNRIVECQTEQGDYPQAIRYASQLLDMNPLDEAGHRSLMRLYMMANQPFAAINQYHACVELLDQELGLVPEPETRELYQQIIQRPEESERTTRSASGGVTTLFPVAVYPPRPSMIVGRNGDLSRIRALLKADRNAHANFTANAQISAETRAEPAAEDRTVIVIQGWPGVGKSALAALLAHESHTVSMFPDGVLWAAVGEQPDVMGILSRWATALGMPGAPAERSLDELSMWLRRALENRRVLIIVDDVWSAELLTWFQLGGAQSALVITTRLNEVAGAVMAESKTVYRLDILDDNSALALMRRLAPDVTAKHPREMVSLIHDLEGLPLALQVAGRLLKAEMELGWGIADLLADLREGAALLEAAAPIDRADPVNGMTPTLSTLLMQSTNRLDEIHRLYFASLGLFAPKPATFSADALAAIWDVSDPRRSIRLLVNRGLMEPVGKGRFQVHALLVKHARSLFAS